MLRSVHHAAHHVHPSQVWCRTFKKQVPLELSTAGKIAQQHDEASSPSLKHRRPPIPRYQMSAGGRREPVPEARPLGAADGGRSDPSDASIEKRLQSEEELVQKLVEDALRPPDEAEEEARARLVAQYESLPQQHAYVALCSIFKNEHGHVEQWIDYHRWLGVGKFYVFDHSSSPPLSGELERYILEGIVEVHYFSGNSWQLDAGRYNSSSRTFLSPQAWAYDSCFK